MEGIIRKILICWFFISPAFSFAEEQFSVSRVGEDYTLHLNGDRQVRLIGLDIPRNLNLSPQKKDATIHSFQKLSYYFVKNLVEGKKISLEFDTQMEDRFNRELAYAYLEGGTFLNNKIIKEGYASAINQPVNSKYIDEFLESESYAMENKNGLWGILDYIATEFKFMDKINLDLLKDGVYSGSDTTPLGSVEIKLTVERGKIDNIRIVRSSFHEYGPIAESIVAIPQSIVTHQSPDVDAITGATVTSNSIRYAVFRALKEATAER